MFSLTWSAAIQQKKVKTAMIGLRHHYGRRSIVSGTTMAAVMSCDTIYDAFCRLVYDKSALLGQCQHLNHVF